jgi:hypothetical protein
MTVANSSVILVSGLPRSGSFHDDADARSRDGVRRLQ